MSQEVSKDMETKIQKDNKKISTNSAYEYTIELYDVWDTTSKRLPAFGANRIVEGNTSYLFNEQKGFKEPFPENSEEFKEFTIEETTSKIKELEKRIKQLEQNNNSSSSIRDIKRQLRIFRGYKRSLELKGIGSFMILNEFGKPTFMFDRVGDVKLPLYKNVEKSTLYIPSELKTKNSTKLLKENDEKNGKETTVKLATYALILLLVLLTLGYLWFGYKAMTLPVDVADTMSRVADAMLNIDKSLNNIESNINITNVSEVNTNPNVNTIN